MNDRVWPFYPGTDLVLNLGRPVKYNHGRQALNLFLRKGSAFNKHGTAGVSIDSCLSIWILPPGSTFDDRSHIVFYRYPVAIFGGRDGAAVVLELQHDDAFILDDYAVQFDISNVIVTDEDAHLVRRGKIPFLQLNAEISKLLALMGLVVISWPVYE